jgi:hypothetical protein
MQGSTAGRLLGEIHRESPSLRDTVATVAGIGQERAQESMTGATRLTLAEQLRLAEAVLLLAPRFGRLAARLRGQALAARSYDSGDVQLHRELSAQRWERSPQMRR